MWSATAEVEEFDEAVSWFKDRLPVTTLDLAKFGDKARDKAFWITGIAQLDIVADVHASIIDALKKGTPFEEWQKSVSQKLTDAWGKKNAWRVETIYRNATQQAYITGRMRQLRDPVVLKLRPFWTFVAIDDGRCPTRICPTCNGTILPPDHPWWLTHTPQMHHSCRCRLDAMRMETAQQRGGETAEPTDLAPDEGFGSPPDLQTVEEFKAPIRKRIEKKVAPELVNEFNHKQATQAPKRTPIEEMMLKASNVLQSLPEAPGDVMGLTPDVKHRVRRLEELSEESVSKLSEDQRQALLGFSLGHDYEIRALQRGVSKSDLIASRRKLDESLTEADASKHIDQSDQYRETLETVVPTAIDFRLFRGMSASSRTLAELLTQELWDNAKMLTSSSAKPMTAEGFADQYVGEKDYRGDTMEHRVVFVFAPGCKAIPMASDKLSNFSMESEALLPGSARYKITKREVYRNGDNKYVLFHMTEIP
jgi:hypothetical protein